MKYDSAQVMCKGRAALLSRTEVWPASAVLVDQ